MGAGLAAALVAWMDVAPAAEANKDYSSGRSRPALAVAVNIVAAAQTLAVAVGVTAAMIVVHYPVAAGDIHGQDCHCERAHLYIQVDLGQVVEVAVDPTYYS